MWPTSCISDSLSQEKAALEKAQAEQETCLQFVACAARARVATLWDFGRADFKTCISIQRYKAPASLVALT